MINDLNVRIEEYYPDIELYGSGNVDYGHNLAEALLVKGELERVDRTINLKKDYEFVEKANKLGLNPERIFEHTFEKSKLLKTLKGYSRLKADNLSGKESISHSSSSKIGLVFRNVYNSSLKKINSN